MNYHTEVSRMLTEIVRNGGTVETEARGIRICGLPAASGAYETLYHVDTYLYREERDEYGRVRRRDMYRNGMWEEVDK